MTPTPLPPRGWYVDPADATRERYWDSTQWTQRVRRRAEPVPLPHVDPWSPQAWGPDQSGTTPVGPNGPAAAAASPSLPAPGPTDQPAGNPFAATGVTPRSAAPTAAPRGVALAGWGRRCVAALVDYLMLSLAVALVMVGVAQNFTTRLAAGYSAWFREIIAQAQAGTTALTIPEELLNQINQLTLVLAAATALYAIAFVGAWGFTPGQRLLGLKVIAFPAQPDPALTTTKAVTPEQAQVKPGWRRSISRGLIWALLATGSSIFLLVSVFNALMPLWHPRRQALHDSFSRTLVVRSR